MILPAAHHIQEALNHRLDIIDLFFCKVICLFPFPFIVSYESHLVLMIFHPSLVDTRKFYRHALGGTAEHLAHNTEGFAKSYGLDFCHHFSTSI